MNGEYKRGVILLNMVFSFFYLSSCENDPALFPESEMPKFSPPLINHTEPKPTPPVSREITLGDAAYRWHRSGYQYPYKRATGGGGFCVMCHGKDLKGSVLTGYPNDPVDPPRQSGPWGKPPSCYTCHSQKWSEEGKENLDLTIGNPSPDSTDLDLTFESGQMPKFDPPLQSDPFHSEPKPTPPEGGEPIEGDPSYRWHKGGYLAPMETCGPVWACRCCHGSEDLTGGDLSDDGTKSPPSCYTCHNKAWED